MTNHTVWKTRLREIDARLDQLEVGTDIAAERSTVLVQLAEVTVARCAQIGQEHETARMAADDLLDGVQGPSDEEMFTAELRRELDGGVPESWQ